MAQEKKKATLAIINELQKQKEQIILQEHDAVIDTYKQSIEDYKKEIEKMYQDKLKAQETLMSQEIKQVTSSQRYRQMQEMLSYRKELLDQFTDDLKADIERFRSSDAYPVYLDTVLQSVSNPTLVICDVKDEGFIDFHNITTVTLPLGGIKIETETQIYDFTLKSRLDEAIGKFQTIVELQIKEGQYE